MTLTRNEDMRVLRERQIDGCESFSVFMIAIYDSEDRGSRQGCP